MSFPISIGIYLLEKSECMNKYIFPAEAAKLLYYRAVYLIALFSLIEMTYITAFITRRLRSHNVIRVADYERIPGGIRKRPLD